MPAVAGCNGVQIMIGTISIECNAKNPNMPLHPLRAYINSPSSLRISNVPKRIGKWCIQNVYLTVVYPDSSVKNAVCVLTGGVWTGTVEGTNTSGTSVNGYTIFADGIDENGNAVTGYILGKGDVVVLDANGTLTPDPARYYVRMLSAESANPQEGDLYPTDSGYVIWQDGEANPLGTPFGIISTYVESQVSGKADLTALNDYATTTALNEGLELKADLTTLSSKADVSAIHGDYIQDSVGNKIQANRNAIEISTYYVVNAFYSDILGEFVDEREGIWSNDSYNAFISADSQTIGKWNVWIEDFYIAGEPKNAVGYFFTTNGEVVWTEGDLVGDRSIAINAEQSQQQTVIYMKLASEFYAEELTRQLSNDIEVELSTKVDLSTLADYSTKAELENKADLSTLADYAPLSAIPTSYDKIQDDNGNFLSANRMVTYDTDGTSYWYLKFNGHDYQLEGTKDNSSYASISSEHYDGEFMGTLGWDSMNEQWVLSYQTYDAGQYTWSTEETLYDSTSGHDATTLTFNAIAVESCVWTTPTITVTEHLATQEWVLAQLSALEARIVALENQ